MINVSLSTKGESIMKDSQKSLMSRVGISVLVLGLFVVQGVRLRTAASASAQPPQGIQQLPISAFLDLLPPRAATAWEDPASGNLVVIDAYGKRNVFFNLNLDTTVTGMVTVKDQGDGTQKVDVSLLTKNAICWGFNGNFDPAFGYRPPEVANGLGPASLGDALTRIDFTEPTGPLSLPMDVTTESAAVLCDGQLRFGSGHPDGTPGFAQTTQTGLFSTGVPGGCPPEKDADCFPAEKVQFKATGN
jgi:hypothetical protein